MAQPHKGSRRRVASRFPDELIEVVEAYAQKHGLTISDAVADLTHLGLALDGPVPSETLPKPKTQRQREELPLAMSA